MTQKKNIRIIVAAGFLLAMIVLLTACGSTGIGTMSPVSATVCSQSTTNVAANTPTVAVLGETGSNLGAYQPDINMVVNAASNEKARIIVNGVTTASTAPDLLTNVVLEGDGNNNLERNQNLKCKMTAVNGAFATLRNSPASGQPNAFDAITTLAGNLNNGPSKQPVDVVLLTPLKASAGGVDLSKPGRLEHPVAAINKLASNGLIPNCTNYRFYGVSPDSGLTDVEAAKLRQFWLLYAKKCGGEFVAWEPHLATFPVTSAIGAADFSQMKVEVTPKTVTATLSSDVLFSPDSATLQAAATHALSELAGLANQYTGEIIITGYVNPVVPGINSPGDRALSSMRAMAVASWLVAHNVSEARIRTNGRGSADALYPNPTADAQRAANRRVVAVVYTQGA